ncbi:MAG TPA: PQQ-dependent sugar dehydrogenase [Longimicrobiaceae bacterium]|nr:PQQ-dependent sugar dehydrogenase [Longimicrobiaceae bacterium]
MSRSIVLPLALAGAAAACGASGGAVPAAEAATPAQASSPQRCEPGNGGITLPRGFCAVVFADVEGGPRHLAVAPDGAVYVALAGRRAAAGGTAVPGGLLALRDTDGDGKADVRERVEVPAGSGVAVRDGWLYYAPNDGVLRWRLTPGRLTPAGAPETVVRGLPTGGHSAKTIALDGSGGLFVNIGSRTNACQAADRQAGSPGVDPCVELQERAGVWRFDAAGTDQAQAAGARFGTGIRNAVAITVGPGGALYVVQHGRDQLHASWPALFTERQNAENPAEELLRVERGDDFGWPYCFYSVEHSRKVLAPEYGGDGRQAGRCASAKAPLATFPGHWAPEAIVFYTGTAFPAYYRGGAFVSFHGSWNRAPLPQEGFKVMFVPFRGGTPGAHETFADGFRGAGEGAAAHRPMGLAVAPDGALYVSDDTGGRIWRIVYQGT